MHVVRMRNKDKGFTKIFFVEESLYMYRRKYVPWLQLTKTLISSVIMNMHIYKDI